MNGRIAPVNWMATSCPSIAFNASIIYFALKEIFKSSPVTSIASTSSSTFPTSGEFEEISMTLPSSAEKRTILFRSSRARSEACQLLEEDDDHLP